MPHPSIDDLRDEHGRFSMLAIDQRGSLRTMLARGGSDATIADADLVAFKVDVARALSPAASAILLDRDFGEAAAQASECPIILAADILSASVPGGPVDTATLDPELTPEVVARFGAVALKQLVPWTPDTRAAAIALSEEFMRLCRDTGLPGIVEGVVRPLDIDTWDDDRRNDAILTAARDLAGTAPDLYKAEVPSYGRGRPEVITAVAAAITEALDCPWVVLSSGVAAADFPDAVAACRQGGVSGFLAGRAIWADAIQADDPSDFLRTVSVERLRSLAAAA